jgi:hypothetical protein
MSVTKTELYTILRDVCIVSNRLTCIDAKLSEMEILAQPLSLPFIIENLRLNQHLMISAFGRFRRAKKYFFHNFFDSLGY